MQHDVFICHASEDKDELVRPLARALRDANLDVWYDEFSLQVGDSLSEAIDRGLAGARFGIVVVSQAFFQKRWTKRELRGLVAREMAEDGKIILPVWHGVSYGEVLGFSPPLADVRAAMANQGVEALARELVRKIRPEGSPLLIARDELLRFDWDTKRPHALCSRSLALRHATFGNHTAADVADRWTWGLGYELNARLLNELDYVFWLCADDSAWLPAETKSILIKGVRDLARWADELSHRDRWKTQLSKVRLDRRDQPLKWTKTLRADLANLAEETTRRLALETPVERIVEAFIAHDIMGGQDERLRQDDLRIEERRRRSGQG